MACWSNCVSISRTLADSPCVAAFSRESAKDLRVAGSLPGPVWDGFSARQTGSDNARSGRQRRMTTSASGKTKVRRREGRKGRRHDLTRPVAATKDEPRRHEEHEEEVWLQMSTEGADNIVDLRLHHREYSRFWPDSVSRQLPVDLPLGGSQRFLGATKPFYKESSASI